MKGIQKQEEKAVIYGWMKENKGSACPKVLHHG
jgi:hypothetical protein